MHTITTAEGLMMTKELTFHNWLPGQSTSRNILLKNVGTDPISVTYTCPATPEFKTSFPKRIDLFTGNAFRVAVTFEPTKKKLYEDVMLFFVQDTVVTVSLRADLPRLAVRLSEQVVDFQERPCGMTMHKHFQIINCG
ncbi:hypothetical protein RvY_12519 [Ramazzottius varieornatus]|uniref:Cep192-like domain-containing protein n=1 Tax=Ramazzottius varieornatus TaxID=947166 RepID=A0A1D1VJU4_RAMVA|nr:hypothetical protein RvY_12519 [Ramazzottius varieornatus]